ncbi:MAG: hypothetical protein WC953_07945 [Pseudomonas sp.]
MNSEQPDTDAPIQHYSEVLLARAAPIFEQAARAAQALGLHALVHTQGNPPTLCLQVSHHPQGFASHYLIQFDGSSAKVHHQLYFANEGTQRTLPGGIDSINNMVLDTQLSELFREGFSLSLPPLEQRHPKGFW